MLMGYQLQLVAQSVGLSNEGLPRLVQQTHAARESKQAHLEEKQRLKEKDKYEPGESQHILLAREEAPSQMESSQTDSSSRRFPRRLVILILLALILLSGVSVGSLLYRTAIGHFPWQASPGLSTSSLSAHAAQPSVRALGQSWQSGNLNNSGDLSGVAWSDSHFVAVGGSCKLFVFFCSGVIYTSLDGITWTSQNSTTSQHLSSVAWSGSVVAPVWKPQ